jgi:hypothetical protein
VRDEGSNLNAMTSTLKSIISCETLGLQKKFNGTYFGHFFPKHVNMLLLMKQVCKNLRYVYIKTTPTHFQKCIV